MTATRQYNRCCDATLLTVYSPVGPAAKSQPHAVSQFSTQRVLYITSTAWRRRLRRQWLYTTCCQCWSCWRWPSPFALCWTRWCKLYRKSATSVYSSSCSSSFSPHSASSSSDASVSSSVRKLIYNFTLLNYLSSSRGFQLRMHQKPFVDLA